jgi:hypothetical protein
MLPGPSNSRHLAQGGADVVREDIVATGVPFVNFPFSVSLQ